MSETTSAAEGLEQLLSLEEKIHQTIHLLQSTRAEKQELLGENARLRHELEEQDRVVRTLEDRVGRLEKEREAVRTRVQKLIEQVDSLTSLPAGAS